jgi:uncharacterized protein
MANATDLDLVLLKAAQFVEELSHSIRVSGAYLFGSYAKNQATTDSDIDVLIVSPDFGEDGIADLLMLMKARRGIDRRIEPHPIHEKDFNQEHPLFWEVNQNLIQIK